MGIPLFLFAYPFFAKRDGSILIIICQYLRNFDETNQVNSGSSLIDKRFPDIQKIELMGQQNIIHI